MDEYKSDPQKFRSHATVKPTMKKIAIKTERDVERRLEIKAEPQSPCPPVQIKQKRTVATWQEEKESMVNKIVALKAENQRNLLTLKKAQAAHDLVLLSKQQMEQTISKTEASFSMQLNELKLQLSNAKKELLELKLSTEKTISELKRDKQMLTARVKQFQAGMQQKASFENSNSQYNSDSEDDLFEVESIMDHRNSKSGRQYLIRWKGYGQSHDTWEKEANLTCPQILNKYIRSIGSNKK